DGGDMLGGSLVGSYGGSFVQIRGYRQRREIAFAPYDSDPGIDPPTEVYNYQLLVEGGHTRQLSDRLSASVRGYTSLYRYFDRIRHAANDVFVDYGDAGTIGAELRGRYELIVDETAPNKPSKLAITAGGEANYNRTESRSYTEGMEAEGAKVPLNFNVEGMYTELDGQPTEWFGFTGGLRFDRNSVIDRRLSPRAALFLAQPERYGLKLLYAQGFRNPSAFEGFFTDIVDFSANPDIKSETIRSYEAVVWAKPVTGLSTRLSAFRWDARDVIEQRPDPADDTLLQFQNVGRYVTEGLEAEASYRNSQGWYGFGGLSVARIGSAEAGAEIAFDQVVNAPQVVATGGISTPRIGGFAHLSADVHFVSRRLTRIGPDGMRGPDAPGWTGLNAAIYVPSIRKFDVTAGVRNLLGKRDLVPAPGDFDRFPDGGSTVFVPRIPGEGRELYVKIGYSY
ncbi:MAG: TonB-dependent receptor plug domain-containing protein, partial [Kofleriaceae bacterium]